MEVVDVPVVILLRELSALIEMIDRLIQCKPQMERMQAATVKRTMNTGQQVAMSAKLRVPDNAFYLLSK